VIEISWMAAGATRYGVHKLGVELDDARVHGARHMQAWPRRSSFFYYYFCMPPEESDRTWFFPLW
jgi:hypothetical protein